VVAVNEDPCLLETSTITSNGPDRLAVGQRRSVLFAASLVHNRLVVPRRSNLCSAKRYIVKVQISLLIITLIASVCNGQTPKSNKRCLRCRRTHRRLG